VAFFFIGGGELQAHEVCCVMMCSEKALNPVQTWLPGFSVMHNYT